MHPLALLIAYSTLHINVPIDRIVILQRTIILYRAKYAPFTFSCVHKSQQPNFYFKFIEDIHDR